LEQGDGKFIVKYIPVEVGVFTLAVTWNGKDIPGMLELRLGLGKYKTHA